MISRFYTTTFTIKRLTYASNIGTWGATGTFLGHLQQVTQEQVIRLANALVVSHAIWCATDTDVEIGDALEITGRTFTVRAIQTNDTGANAHLELLVEEDTEPVSA
ncbi:MAG: hypothetical protein Q8Q08_12815 [Candidatus Omnitrophota bacterium]|nr:hypothetical protein [Candidatus Omnitrophota bacterium]